MICTAIMIGENKLNLVIMFASRRFCSDSPLASIPACHAGDLDSIPRRGV